MLIALEQELQRVAWRHHAGDALRPAGAGKETDLDLGQSHPRLCTVGGDAMMAGEAKLEPAADRHAVDCRHPRLAAGLDAAIEQREFSAFLEQQYGGSFLAARLGDAGEAAAERLQHG